MSSILIGIFTLVLVIVCILLVLVILMQRPNANSGMGSALGGGAAEGMFGGEAGNVLTKATVKLTVLFFVISAGLYLGYIWQTGGSKIEQPQTLSLSAVSGKEEKSKPATSDATKKSEAVKKEVEKKAEAPAKK
ncbi:MAG: preprotein translocase subunit SecG [Opitutales bacterium]|nr:preprotein translocase subunit SecG [Opitutales bacterium]